MAMDVSGQPQGRTFALDSFKDLLGGTVATELTWQPDGKLIATFPRNLTDAEARTVERRIRARTTHEEQLWAQTDDYLIGDVPKTPEIRDQVRRLIELVAGRPPADAGWSDAALAKDATTRAAMASNATQVQAAVDALQPWATKPKPTATGAGVLINTTGLLGVAKVQAGATNDHDVQINDLYTQLRLVTTRLDTVTTALVDLLEYAFTVAAAES